MRSATAALSRARQYFLLPRRAAGPAGGPVLGMGAINSASTELTRVSYDKLRVQNPHKSDRLSRTCRRISVQFFSSLFVGAVIVPYFRSSLAVLGVVAACVPLSVYASETLTPKQRYDAAIDLVATDPEAGVQEMNLVAEEGYARAMDRMAYYYHKGIGVEVDNDRAVRLYQMAISEGREKSLISLGKTYIAIGEADAALEALDRVG